MNKVILSGRLATDVELKATPGGASVVKAQIAVRRSYKDKEGQYITDFINLTFWRQQAEFVSKHFKKGQSIEIVGALEIRNYTDNEGKKRAAYDVVVSEVYFGAVSKAEQAEEPAEPTEPPTDSYTGIDDDLLF